jgi:hypothetical protein
VSDRDGASSRCPIEAVRYRDTSIKTDPIGYQITGPGSSPFLSLLRAVSRMINVGEFFYLMRRYTVRLGFSALELDIFFDFDGLLERRFLQSVRTFPCPMV